MKKLIIIFMVISFIANKAQDNRILNLSSDLFISNISDNVLLVTHKFPWAANSLVYKADKDNIVLIDTPYEPEATRLLISFLKKRFGDVSFSAVVTGFHIDNLGGTKYLLDQNIPVYGSTKTVELLKDKSEKTHSEIMKFLTSPKQKRFYDAYKNFEYFPPNKLFNLKDELTLNFSDVQIEVFFPGETHTMDNLIVWLPNENILFGGCMILAEERNKPGFIKDANMKEWPNSVKSILNKYKDCEKIIPGHGKIGGNELLNHTIKVLENFNSYKQKQSEN